MTPNAQVAGAIEALDYRVTAGDVVAQSGLDLQVAERDLLALASEGGGHLQVSEAGEIAFAFPKDFRAILRRKSFRLRLAAFWQKVWPILFAGIRISFGILLLVSIALVYIAILVAIVSASSSQKEKGRRVTVGAFRYIDIRPFWYLFFNLSRRMNIRSRQPRNRTPATGSPLNFLEAVYSFLFGDGNPNANLEEERWQFVAGTIRTNGGAIAAEQVTPYLDELGTGDTLEYEDYMLPVLTRFNGIPEVSPRGEMIYHFPELQVTAEVRQQQGPPPFLQASPWQFSAASAQQIVLAVVLGAVNLVGIAMLGSLLRDTDVVDLEGLYGFVSSIYWLLLGYGLAFLVIPVGRYFWIQWRNRAIEAKNRARQQRAQELASPAGDSLQQKLDYARTFADRVTVAADDLLYSSEKDLASQELERAEQIGADWEQRLESATSPDGREPGEPPQQG